MIEEITIEAIIEQILTRIAVRGGVKAISAVFNSLYDQSEEDLGSLSRKDLEEIRNMLNLFSEDKSIKDLSRDIKLLERNIKFYIDTKAKDRLGVALDQTQRLIEEVKSISNIDSIKKENVNSEPRYEILQLKNQYILLINIYIAICQERENIYSENLHRIIVDEIDESIKTVAIFNQLWEKWINEHINEDKAKTERAYMMLAGAMAYTSMPYILITLPFTLPMYLASGGVSSATSLIKNIPYKDKLIEGFLKYKYGLEGDDIRTIRNHINQILDMNNVTGNLTDIINHNRYKIMREGLRLKYIKSTDIAVSTWKTLKNEM